MEKSLIMRWMEAVKPLELDDIKRDWTEQYCNRVGVDPEMRARMHKAMDSLRVDQLREIMATFAEEHFSEPVLAAAVAFFESDMGKKYLEQRRQVITPTMAQIAKLLVGAMRREFGDAF